MLYLAIDQHAKQLTVSLRDEAGQVRLRRQLARAGESPRVFRRTSGTEPGGWRICRHSRSVRL